MKSFAFLLLFLFPIILFGQISKEDLEKKKIIDAHITQIDSVAAIIPEEVENEVIIASHGKQDEIFANTYILKESGQILRIRYKIGKAKTDEDFRLYYFNSKLIFGELAILNKKKKKSIKKQFYYEDKYPICPSIIYSKWTDEDIDFDTKITIKSEELMEQAGR
jgi:hypothetical protein